MPLEPVEDLLQRLPQRGVHVHVAGQLEGTEVPLLRQRQLGQELGDVRTDEVAAEQRAVPFSSHLSPDCSAHVLAATPTRHWLEFMDWGQDLLDDPLVPVKGLTTPRDKPGTGIAWNEKAIARCLVAG